MALELGPQLIHTPRAIGTRVSSFFLCSMSAEQVIGGLQQARQMAFSQPETLSQVVQAVCTMGDTTTFLQVQQWCSQFFCDVLSPEAKEFSFSNRQDICKTVLPSLITLSKVQDVTVYKNVVLAATSMYDMVFDLVAKISDDHLWSQMTSLKHSIITQWNTPYPLTPNGNDTDKFRSIGARVAATKFIARVITIQTSPPTVADPRRRGSPTDSDGISVSKLNDSHAVLRKSHLEAEGNGLFDVLVNFFDKEEFLVSETFVAVLENLVYIIQKRRHLASRVFAAIAAIDLDSKYQHASHSTLRYKLGRRFMERAIKNALNYCIRAGIITPQIPQHSTFTKMVSQIDSKMVEQKRKGIMTNLPGDKFRKKMKVDPTNPFARDVLTVDDKSMTSVYQLIDDNDPLINFDVTQIPAPTLANICIAAISRTDTTKLITALSIVSARYTDLTAKAGGAPGSVPPQVKAEVKEEQILENDDADNAAILQSEAVAEEAGADINLDSTFVLPAPEKLNEEQKKKHLNLIIQNFFKLANLPADDKSISSFNLHTENANASAKITQVAINDWEKTSWVVLLTRLATRGMHTSESDNSMADQIREAIFQYVLENWHERIEILIEWLNEEWYSEFTINAKKKDKNETTPVETPLYVQWAARVFDTMIPFLEAGDRKLFIRLISDLPYLNADLVSRIKSLCIDPQRSTLGFQSLQFLIMFRPPVKQACVDILHDLYKNNEDLKETAEPLLKKYAPDLISE
ncbi:CYFA0S02e09802g1_1 [Cyberlindnera fabianii]|uniref:CYFA0S02e09802g1_1 n=1 Tax=Cyberlindnera fabianii TaxID=36022 RepID=A0A061APD2_CYBFA|nr:CYFA0S02e09802g1_1 [Cyberlindnera fabianii]